ncbi:MAG: OadG family protein [Eubacteriales bacterium]|nr:OadG family protein [Eubacteriales bacterium]MDD3109497.1 OadG family protein [Eubacteriales bacterium]MDD3571530.1 OadG family protein [Eubacteriales bacterium]MDD4134451.1 OadG family protein [Eubacteriales bacterium]
MQNTPWWAAILLVLNIIMLFIGLRLIRRQPEVPFSGAKTDLPAEQASVPAVPTQAIPDRQKLIAAVTAAIAEYEGTDISALRIVSFNKRRQA